VRVNDFLGREMAKVKGEKEISKGLLQFERASRGRIGLGLQGSIRKGEWGLLLVCEMMSRSGRGESNKALLLSGFEVRGEMEEFAAGTEGG
jgi:hypothetical protein